MFHPQSGPLQSEEISEITSDRELARESFLQLDQLYHQTEMSIVDSCLYC